MRSAPGETETGRLPISALTNLARGISLDELAKQTGVKPTHQFTARLGSNEFTCVTMAFSHPRGKLNFLFANDKLAAIQDRPKVEFETTRTSNGIPRQAPKPIDTELCMNTVVQSPDLTASEIVQRLEQWLKNEVIASKGRQPENILPAFVITAPLFAAKEASNGRAETEAAKLTERFDPFKAKLGMTPASVEALFGTPVFKREEGNKCQLHVYGSHLPSNLPVYVPQVWVSIVFCDDKAMRVFSHDFFDKRLAPQRSSPQ